MVIVAGRSTRSLDVTGGSMIAILIAAFLSSTPSITSPESGIAGDLVATWTHANSDGLTSISLDADGRCSIAGEAKSGRSYRSGCGYWIRGSSVFLRLQTDKPGLRPELEATYDRSTDLLTVGGDVFSRSPLSKRRE